jgi:hypothetical protein
MRLALANAMKHVDGRAMPDLPQGPMARVEAEILRLRERAARLEAELKQARAQIKEQRATARSAGTKLPPRGADML